VIIVISSACQNNVAFPARVSVFGCRVSGVGEQTSRWLRLPTPDNRVQLGEHLTLKPFARERRRVCADSRAVPIAALRFAQRSAKRVYRRGLEKNPGRSGDYRVAHAAGAEGDDRRAEGHRFQWSDAEVFDTGKDEALRAPEVVDDHLCRYGPEELNVGSAASAKLGEKRTAADDDQPSPTCLGCFDRKLDPFVRNERRKHDMKIVARLAKWRREKCIVDEWMHDRGVAAVVLADPFANEIGVGDKTRDAF
jgi:hypothetical protein